MLLTFGALLAYLIGSVPTAVWLGKAAFGIDVRDHGSGNAGATNTFRTLGGKAGAIVMAVDVLKGWAAASLSLLVVMYSGLTGDHIELYKLTYGLCAVIGHIFPIYAGFRGGKGVATLLGMVIAIHIEASLICVGVFLIVFIASKYVSLGSIMAALAFPVLLLMPKFNPGEPIVIIFAFALFAIVVLTHQKNIRRLIKGEESKIHIGRRNKG